MDNWKWGGHQCKHRVHLWIVETEAPPLPLPPCPWCFKGLVTRVSPQWAEQPTALTNDLFDDVSSYFESFPVSLSLLPTLAPGNVHPDKVLSHQSLPRALLPGESRLNQWFQFEIWKFQIWNLAFITLPRTVEHSVQAKVGSSLLEWLCVQVTNPDIDSFQKSSRYRHSHSFFCVSLVCLYGSLPPRPCASGI